jgi:C4-dicarboxylate-specific signal transduction histidine kinase
LKTRPQRILFNVLQQQVASALKGALLIQEIKDKEKTLAILLEDQNHRATELENAYTALKENQTKLLLTDKMASLGRMTAGIAHEMNTPLAAIRAALSELRALTDELSGSVQDPAVSAEDYKGIASDMQKSIQLSMKSAERLASFILSIKSQTTGLSPKDRRSFNAVSVIKDAVLFQSYRLQIGKCRVDFKHNGDPIELFGSPARLSQVVTNLLTNAIDAYKAKNGGLITVSLRADPSGTELSVEDKGSGMSREVMQKIFDPLFSTKSLAEGTGLGLTITHDIVTGEFGGSIDVESQVDKGTRFLIRFPPHKSAGTIL